MAVNDLFNFLAQWNRVDSTLKQVAILLHCNIEEIPEKSAALLDDIKRLKQQINKIDVQLNQK